MAVAEVAPVLYAFKRGRMTVSREPAMIHRPHEFRTIRTTPSAARTMWNGTERRMARCAA